MRGFQPNTKNRARREKLKKRASPAGGIAPPLVSQHAPTGPRSRKKELQLARARAHATRDAAAAAAAAALVAPAKGGKRAMLVDA